VLDLEELKKDSKGSLAASRVSMCARASQFEHCGYAGLENAGCGDGAGGPGRRMCVYACIDVLKSRPDTGAEQGGGMAKRPVHLDA
jgi:hypothetical protein